MAYKEKSTAIKYNNDFNKKAYDRINLTVPKGQKEAIQAAAAAAHESVNAYIYAAIKQRMEKESTSQVATGSTEDSTRDGFSLSAPSDSDN